VDRGLRDSICSVKFSSLSLHGLGASEVEALGGAPASRSSYRTFVRLAWVDVKGLMSS